MQRHAGKIHVGVLSDEEVPTSFAVISDGFGHDAPFFDIYFPAHDTPSGQVHGSRRLKEWKNSAPDSVFLKAVTRSTDVDQGRIIGLAVWSLMKEPPPGNIAEVENAEEIWPDENDREFMARIWRDFVVLRGQAVTQSSGKGVYVLELLAVHPDHRRLGAGTALVDWGLRAADEEGLRAVVEGTPAGRPLYEKCGFRVEVEEIPFHVGDEFGNRRKPKLAFLSKEPRS